jgi:hypothetical protein
LKTPKTWTLPWSLVCKSHQCSPIPIAFPPPHKVHTHVHSEMNQEKIKGMSMLQMLLSSILAVLAVVGM